jgi:hypothetical protein
MRPILIATIYALSLSATPVLADATTPPQSTPDAQHLPDGNNDDDSKVICMNRIHEGTVTNTVDCKTKRTWDKIRRDNQHIISEMQLRGLTSQGH